MYNIVKNSVFNYNIPRQAQTRSSRRGNRETRRRARFTRGRAGAREAGQRESRQGQSWGDERARRKGDRGRQRSENTI